MGGAVIELRDLNAAGLYYLPFAVINDRLLKTLCHLCADDVRDVFLLYCTYNRHVVEATVSPK
jgi:hypothetical protein